MINCLRRIEETYFKVEESDIITESMKDLLQIAQAHCLAKDEYIQSVFDKEIELQVKRHVEKLELMDEFTEE